MNPIKQNRKWTARSTPLKKEFAGLRTGRRFDQLLDNIQVRPMAAVCRLSQCGTVGVPEPRL